MATEHETQATAGSEAGLSDSSELLGATDYRTAPYDDLCDCVAVRLTGEEARSYDNMNAAAWRKRIEQLLRIGKRERIVLVNCKNCRGTGIAPNTGIQRLRSSPLE